MKRIYFVRHGESESNATRTTRGSVTPLTEKGRQQARKTALRFLSIDPEVILTSPYPRALETAQIIAGLTGKPVEECASMHESIKPSSFIGMRVHAPERKQAEAVYYEHLLADDRTYRHSNEESFKDLLLRATEALRYLELRPESHIAVVTHGTFLRFLHSYMT